MYGIRLAMRAKTIVWSGAEASWGAFVTVLSPVVRAQDLLPKMLKRIELISVHLV